MKLFNIGIDTVVDEAAIIKRPLLCSLGDHVAIDNAFISVQMFIGNYVHIGPFVSIIGGQEGEFICQGFNNIMAGARIICSSDRFDDSGLFGSMIPEKYKGTQITKPVVLENFSNVGTNAIVLPGSTLREGVLLTAGSVLMGDTEAWGVYKGNPAVLVKKIDGSKIIENAKKMRIKS